jgi:hypothetical protein
MPRPDIAGDAVRHRHAPDRSGLLLKPELADPTPRWYLSCSFEGEHDG